MRLQPPQTATRAGETARLYFGGHLRGSFWGSVARAPAGEPVTRRRFGPRSRAPRPLFGSQEARLFFEGGV